MENAFDKFFEVNSYNNSVVRSFSLKACLEMASPVSSAVEVRLSAVLDDNTALVSVCKDIALEIQLRKLNLCTFVEELKPFLVNQNVSVREGGVTALSTVLSQLPNDFLNESELHFIVLFFCDRLKDHHSIIPAVLRGILAIVQMDNLPHDAPALLFPKMFENVECQSQLLSDRRNIYSIFITLIQNRLDDLKKIGPDFVYGVISAIDGERDPRNLILLFNILPHFIQEFSLGHLTEGMFDVISCYFPIDFNPIGSEGATITREDLSESLAPCLYAIPEFSEFCIPLISDKLSSSLKVAKLDSLHLLSKGAYVFGVNGLEPYLSELWSVLSKEVMPGGDLEIRNASLKALAALIEVISTNEKVHQSFIERILAHTKTSLCDVQLSLFRSAEKLLESIAMVNKQTCIYVLRVMVPMCLGQYSTKTSLADKVTILDTLNNFMKIASDLDFSIKSVPELAWTDIPQLYFDEFTQLQVNETTYESAKQSTELRSKVITGLTIQRSYLKESHRVLLYDIICNEIDNGCEEVRNICHLSIVAFANIYPNEVLTFIKEKLDINKDDTNSTVIIRRLEALSVIAKIPELANEILPKVLAIGNSIDSEISLAVLKCLHKLVATRNGNSDIPYFLYNECNIIDKLISFTTDISVDKLSLISSICQSVVRSLSVEDQQMITDKYASSITHNTCESVATVIMSLLISLQQDVKLILDNSLLENLYNLSINSSNSITRIMSCKLLSVILNKMNNVDHFGHILLYLRERIKTNLESDSDIIVKQATVMLHIWLSKAVVIKGSYNSQDCLDNLAQMLKHDEVGKYVAQEYKTLTCKAEDTLISENFCNIKIFYKQRVFEHLLRQNHNFMHNSRQNYLIALTYLLEEIPTELLYMHLSELVMLLIESLSLDNGQLVLSALVVLKLLLDTKNNIFADKMQCFIPKLLDLSTYKSMRVRITALDCLTSYTNYPAILTNIYKQDVLEKLNMVLDDKKRLVRKAAVKARTRWFLVAAPGGIKEQ